MKKTYNQPACLVVALSTTQMMAESLTIYSETGTQITNQNDILVKEDKTSDVSLWDNEW